MAIPLLLEGEAALPTAYNRIYPVSKKPAIRKPALNDDVDRLFLFQPSTMLENVFGSKELPCASLRRRSSRKNMRERMTG
jgi:hypothetical protein